MRALRTLIVVVAIAVLAVTTDTARSASAQTDPAVDGATPLARQPDGQLPLEGTPWRLSWYRWKDAQRVPGPEVAARMTLNGGSLAASGGCTTFSGSYGTVGAALDFDLKRLKENDCAEQTTTVQLAMVDGLRKTARFRIRAGDDGDQLTLFSANGTELLRFGLDDVGSLSPSDWELVAYTVEGTRQAVESDLVGDLTFDAERRNDARRRASGEVLGSTGCNGFRGEFFRSADVMSFGELAVTDAPCPTALAELQGIVLSVFDSTAITIAMPPEQLLMTSADSGDQLEYRRVPSLEGATWLLASAADRDRSGDIVTLRLDSGTAAGEGPCGPYAADYVTDGVFITFSDVRGAGDDSCARAKDERRLLAALRAAVSVDRDSGKDATPRLTLRDARATALARFEYPFSSP